MTVKPLQKPVQLPCTREDGSAALHQTLIALLSAHMPVPAYVNGSGICSAFHN